MRSQIVIDFHALRALLVNGQTSGGIHLEILAVVFILYRKNKSIYFFIILYNSILPFIYYYLKKNNRTVYAGGLSITARTDIVPGVCRAEGLLRHRSQ